MLIYCIASLIYLILSFTYSKLYDNMKLYDIIKDYNDTDLLVKYNKIRKRHIMMFIIGLIISLIIITLIQPTDIINHIVTKVPNIINSSSEIQVVQ